MKTHIRAGLLALVGSLIFFSPQPVRSSEYLLPPNSGAVNVRTDLVTRGIHSSNAAGNGSTDDTAAIQAAINWSIDRNARYAEATVLYFPNGTYRLTNSLQSRVSTTGFSSGWRSGMILIGQSRDGTVLRLSNNANGFTNTSAPKGVIITGSENPNNATEAADGSGNEAFRHQIQNMTVDVGSGNAGAVGIDFNASNRGTVRDVLIRTSDPNRAGWIGLKLQKNGDGVGPLLIKNVTINGFRTGIQGQNSTFSSTFENITLNNQTVVGVQPGQSMFTFRNLVSTNTVPVLTATSNIAHVTVVGGQFSGGVAGNAAVTNSGKMLLRDIRSSGYGVVVQNNSGGQPSVPAVGSTTELAEFTSHPVNFLFDNAPRTTLRLPIEETPTYVNNNFSQWANVVSYGATAANSSDDDAPAIQAAIDSGAAVVYFPNGRYDVRSPIYIRNNVRMLIGFEASLRKASTFSGSSLVRFDSTNTVLIRNMNLFGEVLHNSAGTLAMIHCDIKGSQYTHTAAGASGKTFMEDVISTVIRIRDGHRFFARQLNTEHSITEFENNAATAWILGYKTEQQFNILNLTNSSQSEIFGGHFFANSNAASDVPVMSIANSRASVNFGVYQASYPLLVRETQNDVTRQALRADMPTRGNGNSVPLFVAGVAKPSSAGTPVPLADYRFTSGSLASSDSDSDSTAGDVTSGGGSGYSISATTVTGRLRATTTNNTVNSIQGKLNNGQHLKFTITAATGKKLSLNSISLGARREGSSPDRLSVYASSDGTNFVSLVENAAVPNISAFQTFSNTQLASIPALQNVSSVQIRVIYHGGSTGLTNGRNDTDNIVVQGFVQ